MIQDQKRGQTRLFIKFYIILITLNLWTHIKDSNQVNGMKKLM